MQKHVCRLQTFNDTFCVLTSFVELIEFVKLNSVYSVEASHRSIFTHSDSTVARVSKVTWCELQNNREEEKKSGRKQREKEREGGGEEKQESREWNSAKIEWKRQ